MMFPEARTAASLVPSSRLAAPACRSVAACAPAIAPAGRWHSRSPAGSAAGAAQAAGGTVAAGLAGLCVSRRRQGCAGLARRSARRRLTLRASLEEYRHFRSADGLEFEIYLDQVLGAGAQGTVYKGLNKTTGGKVAIKVIPTWRLMLEAGGKDKLDVIEEEFATLRRLGAHDNIVSMVAGVDVHRQGSTSPFPLFKFMVMEAVEGRELAEHIALEGPLKESLARHIFLQILAGLAHVHKAGVIHRDLKPENVLVTGPGLISLDSGCKLIDFGVAKCLRDGPLKTVVGTPIIMAPEVAKAKISYAAAPAAEQAHAHSELQMVGAGCSAAQAMPGKHSFAWGAPAHQHQHQRKPQLVIGTPHRFGAKIDVWSAGVVLYTCLAGKVPFQTELEIIESDYQGAPLQHFSEEAKDLLAGMLKKDPYYRLSLEEVLKHPWIACSADDTCTIFDVDYL